MKTNNNLNQWEKRVLSFKFIYSCLILELSKNEMIEKYVQELKNLEDKYIEKIIFSFIQNKEKMFFNVSKLLQENWTIERVNPIDLSIICCALAESIAHKIDAKILIDQSVITAKKYGDEESYKFINSILDQLLG